MIIISLVMSFEIFTILKVGVTTLNKYTNKKSRPNDLLKQIFKNNVLSRL